MWTYKPSISILGIISIMSYTNSIVYSNSSDNKVILVFATYYVSSYILPYSYVSIATSWVYGAYS